MEVKTFEGTTMKEAIKAVKTEFGPEAVILSTSERPLEEDSNTKVYEVKAAKSGGPKMIGASGTAPAQPSVDAPNVLEPLKSSVKRLEELSNKFSVIDYLDNSIQEMRMLLIESMQGRLENQLIGSLSHEAQTVINTLKATGISTPVLNELAKYIEGLAECKNPDKSADYFQSEAIRWILKRLQIAPRWTLVPGSTCIQLFMGATGSGKTMTVAKLASLYASTLSKSKVLIVSHDNLRLAASDQLRVYAKIIGCRFEAIQSADQLNSVVEKHRDCELILIDTAGRSPRNNDQITDLKGYRDLSLPLDMNLVVSATDRPDQLERTIRNFSSVGIQSLSFSKLDETYAYGDIFNLNYKWSIPLSFFCTGQRVPEDLERATKERVIERIFGI